MYRVKKYLIFLLCLILLFPCLNAGATDEKSNKYIKGILPETTVAQQKLSMPLLKSVSDGNGALTDTQFIRTGCVLDTGNAAFKAVVLGDVNGDGYISSADFLMVKRIFLGTYSPEEVYYLAADVNRDGTVNSIDYLLIKRSFLGSYTITTATNAASVPVLLYHHILPDEDKAKAPWSTNTITISVTEFRSHMQMIKDSGFTVISMDDLVEYVRGEKLVPPKSVVITFDDGYKSNTYYASPILREFGFCATVFSQTKFFGDTYEPVYNTSTLQHITKTDYEQNTDVFTQQSHTFLNHNYLTKQTYDAVFADLMKSQAIFNCRYFAYPYGDNNDITVKAVKDAGFEAAFTTVVRNAMVGEDIYRIPRKGITSPMTKDGFLMILNG